MFRDMLRGKSMVLCSAVAALALVGAAPSLAVVVNETYTGPSNRNWSVADNWSGGVVPNNASVGGAVLEYNALIDGDTAQDTTVNLDIDATIDNLAVDAGDTLHIGEGNTLTLVGDGVSPTLTNAGTLNIAGTLDINPTVARGLTNTGIIKAANGSILELTGSIGSVDNTGGTILAQGPSVDTTTPSEVVLSDHVHITGGTLQSRTGGLIRSIISYLHDVTIDGDFKAGNGTFTSLSGTITNSGVMTFAAGDALSRDSHLNIGADTTLTGSGLSGKVIVLTTTGSGALDGGLAVIDTQSGNGPVRLTNHNNVIEGQGIIGDGVAVTNQADGTIDANVSGRILYLAPPNVANAFVNEGSLAAENGGILQLNGYAGGSFTNTGTIEAGDGGTVEFADGAVLTNNSGGTLTGGTYKALSTTHAATLNLPGPNITSNAAAVTLYGAQSSIPQIDTIAHNLAGGEFHIQNERIFSTAGDLDNAGTVEVGTSAALSVNGNYTQTDGVTNVNGTLTASTYALQGGTLVGSGTLTADVNNTGGRINPGASFQLSTAILNFPGLLTITGDYTQNSNGVLDIGLLGPTPGTYYDVLDIAGAADLDGTLNVSLLGDFSPSPGQTFTILNSTDLIGTFSTVNLPSNMTVVYTPTSVILMAVPEPTSLMLVSVGCLTLLSRKRRGPGGWD